MVVEGYYIVEAIVYLLHQVTGERERAYVSCDDLSSGAVRNRELGAGVILYELKTKKKKTRKVNN